jgi:hypothetical protein
MGLDLSQVRVPAEVTIDTEDLVRKAILKSTSQ